MGLCFGARDPRTQAYSIGSNLLVLLSPLWVNAFAYMVVGRMIYYWLPSNSIWGLKARKMTSWFVWIDVVIFFVQATGGSMIENEDPGSAKLGLYIYMGGIGLQQVFLFLFLLIRIKFNVDVRRQGLRRTTSWRRLLYSLYTVLALITIRTIFRLVEFSSSVNGPIPKNEVYFYTHPRGDTKGPNNRNLRRHSPWPNAHWSRKRVQRIGHPKGEAAVVVLRTSREDEVASRF